MIVQAWMNFIRLKKIKHSKHKRPYIKLKSAALNFDSFSWSNLINLLDII